MRRGECLRIFWELLFTPSRILWLRFLLENFHNFLDRIPIACCRWHAEEFLDLAEVTDRFHLPVIKAQNESVLDRNDLEQPVVIRRQTERKRRRRGESLC